MTGPIWTLNSRDNAMLDSMEDWLELTSSHLNAVLTDEHRTTVQRLKSRRVEYDALRNALVPKADKLERAFVFDTRDVQDQQYGYEIAAALLPLLADKDYTCSILTGDLLTKDEFQDSAFEELQGSLVMHRDVPPLSNTHSLYVVYLNNLSAGRAQSIHEGLREYFPYIGYIDATYSSRMKNWLSVTLVPRYVKKGKVFICEHEDDADDAISYNLPGWPVEEAGYKYVSLASVYYSLFLSYKIERTVGAHEGSDVRHSLLAVTDQEEDFSTFTIDIPDDKLTYIAHHGGGFGPAGLVRLSNSALQALIRNYLTRNYIYGMQVKVYDSVPVIKFNIMLQLPRPTPGGNPVRILASFEYQSQAKTLRLITLY
jgi:hypothetical protein